MKGDNTSDPLEVSNEEEEDDISDYDDLESDHEHGRPGAATPQALPRGPLDRRGGIKEAMGLSRDEDGAGEGPEDQSRRRVGLEEEEFLAALSFSSNSYAEK